MKPPFSVRVSCAAAICLQCMAPLASSGDPAELLLFFSAPHKALERPSTPADNEEIDKDGRLSKAWLLQEQGRIGEALKEYQKTADDLPDDAEVHSALGRAAFAAGDLALARGALLKSLELDKRPEVVAAMGELEMEEGRTADALRRFHEWADMEPKSAAAHFALGRAHEAAGQDGEAADSFRAALKLDGQYLEIREHLARALARLEKFDGAWVEYSRVAAFDPQFGGARKNLADLEKRLSKPKDELVRVGRVKSPTAVQPPASPAPLPVLRIGLGAGSKGRLAVLSRVTIRASTPFSVTSAANDKTLLKGKADESWSFEMKGSTAALIASGPSAQKVKIPAGRIRLKLESPGTFIAEALPFGRDTSWAGLSDRELRGELEIRRHEAGRGLAVVNIVNVEEYLYGVVPKEMPGHWPDEALKAQAVIARSEAFYRRSLNLHKNQGVDICDEQHCQVYGGVQAETKSARRAVDETQSQVLTYNGRPAHTLYFSNCGGRTQPGGDLKGWSGQPYWRGVSDSKEGGTIRSAWDFRRWITNNEPAYCAPGRWAGASHYRWSRTVAAGDLERRINRLHPIGDIRAVVPVRRGQGGHVLELRIQGSKGFYTIKKENQIRRYPGLAALRSTLFVVETKYRRGKPESFTFHGAGWGHAVGLCQSGAAGRADAGMDHKSILAAYYPGTSLHAVAQLKN